jgi:excisionase family DNA binding protein
VIRLLAAICRYSRVPRLLSTSQVSDMLGVHPSTVARFVRHGHLPAIRLTPNSPLRFRPEDVRILLDKAGAREISAA